jgi:hypothetical protein
MNNYRYGCCKSERDCDRVMVFNILKTEI